MRTLDTQTNFLEATSYYMHKETGSVALGKDWMDDFEASKEAYKLCLQDEVDTRHDADDYLPVSDWTDEALFSEWDGGCLVEVSQEKDGNWVEV